MTTLKPELRAIQDQLEWELVVRICNALLESGDQFDRLEADRIWLGGGPNDAAPKRASWEKEAS